MIKNISKSYISVFLTFIYWISYENTFFFEAGNFGMFAILIVNFIKLGIPILLFAINGIPILSSKSHVFYYVCFFIFFIIYALVPTIISGDLIEYVKLIPRFIFYITALKIFQKLDNIILLSKMIIGYVFFTFFQYIVGYFLTTLNIDSGIINYGNLMWHGPLGILGNLDIITYFFNFPYIQLRGFWNEPSNASGAIFATYYLTKFINNQNRLKLPRYIPKIILLAGIFTFSLIGYISLLGAFVFGLYSDYKRSNSLSNFFKYLPIIAILLLYIFSRSLVSNGNINNEFILAVTGAHKIIDKEEIDVSGGRYNVFIDDINLLKEYPLGIGVQNVIGKAQGKVSGKVIAENISASAPIFWLVLTGYVGLFLLLFREFFLFRLCIINSKNSVNLQYLFQSFLCVFIQNLSYGTFMTGYFLVLSSFIFGYFKLNGTISNNSLKP